ncbi:MAG: PQQ-dependent sugar dehydrogenase [Pirellulales bacterium]
MRKISALLAVALATAAPYSFAISEEIGARVQRASGLTNPESVVVGFDGRTYISEIGEREKDGDGRVSVIAHGQVVPFAAGLNDPKGIIAVRDHFFVTDKTQLWVIDRDGKATVFVAKEKFPVEPLFLNDVAVDQGGNLYVSDSGLKEGGQGKVFRISATGDNVTLVADEKRIPELKRPNGVLVGRDGKLLLADVLTGDLYRLAVNDQSYEKIASGLGGADGIVEDAGGNLFVSDVRGGKVHRIKAGYPEPVLVAEGFGSAADIAAAFDGKSLLVPDMKNGQIVQLPIAPAAAVAPQFRGLLNPESIVRADNGTFYVTVIGERDKDGDGAVMAFPQNKPAVVFAKGLNDPKGIARHGDGFVVADKTHVVKIDAGGNVSELVAATAFPTTPLFLNDIAVDDAGNVFVSDSGDRKGSGSAVYQIAPDGKITTIIDSQSPLPLKAANGVLPTGDGKLWVTDLLAGDLLLVNLADKKAEKIAGGMPGADGLVFDNEGNLYISQWLTGEVRILAPGSNEPRLIANQFSSAADTCYDEKNGRIMVPDMKAGTITPLPLPDRNPSADVDQSVLEVRIEPVFEEVAIDRPILFMNAADGTNRVFIAGQHGKVFVMPNDPSVTEADVYLDWEAKTAKYEKANEEGFLGMAFHPKYKENGQFFVYYTAPDMPRRSVISRFTVDRNDANKADPASEQIVLEIPQPFPNHNGGTIAFGNDGYLYVGLGDGGSGGDPHGNGQKLDTLLGKILRIDIDHKDEGLGYAVPKDNPFVGQAGTRPEIWALGVRNIWRLSFDRQTGDLWAGEVGQNVWEEVNLVTKGGNYGWNPRESFHRFTADLSHGKPNYIDPLWEYHHEIGKSITGGNVYRGKLVPELEGHYVYADYVTGRVWALKYDAAAKKVVAVRPISGNVAPVMSFGEDESGELYFTTVNGGVYRFASIR